MMACCPVCARLCKASAGKVEQHPQPCCPKCGWLATFVTDETPGRDPYPVTGSGRYTCLNHHAFDEADIVDGTRCTGHKKPL